MTRRRTVVALAVVALAVGIVVVATAALGGEVVYRADSDSMSPTIDVGDLVVAARARADGPRPQAPNRGDVVVFADPGGWGERVARLLGRDDVSTTFVKRVIALPGERVACCTAAGEITIDGVPLDDDARATDGGLASVLAFDQTVPADAVFVLGDARGVSIDSRYLGSVPLDSVLGTMQFVVPLGG